MEIRRIDIESEEYPEALRNIYGPPRELFINGKILPQDRNAIAIVGTRWATHYGLEQCRKLAFDLAIRGVTIVSGMARGIDTAAHKGALKAGGRTIAVLGSGHNNIYPPENKKLYEEIANAGAVVSEFPPDTSPHRLNFPRRNRIISGLSRGVAVIEAAKRSGALITANFALEQGREVFAMPGNISSQKSSGTNALIKEGAKLVEDASDIIGELKYVMPLIKETTEIAGRNAILSPGEKTVFGILDETPKSMDEISNAINLPTEKASEILLKLELKRLIRALPGENFVRK